MKPRYSIRHILPAATLATIAFTLASPTALANTYYWDTNGTTAGLGNTAGTWGTDAFIASLNGPNSRGLITGVYSTANTATVSGDAIYFGTVNLALAVPATTIGTVSGGRTISNIVFGAGQTDPVTLSGGGGTITLAGAPSITVNNASDTIGAVLAGTAGMTKAGSGALVLTGANTYTGTTTISGSGTLKIGDGTNGSLNGTTGTALTFNVGGGIFNVAEAAGSTQSMGALTFSAGAGTVTSTAASGAASATLTFASIAPRMAGATGNFTLATNTTASQNKIALTDTTNAPLDSGSNNAGLFFNGTEYARYDSVNGYFRAVVYGTDANAPAPLSGANIGAVTSSTDVKLNGNITAQTTAQVNTIQLNGNSLTFQDSSQVLDVGGILSNGGSISAGGAMEGLTSGAEIVFNVPGGNLSVASTIQESSLTKRGAGTLTLSGTNSYDGITKINAGTLSVSGGSAISDTGAVVLANAASAVFQTDGSETIGNLSGGGFSGGNVNVQGNTLTLGDSSNQAFGGTFSGTSGGTVIKQGAGKLTLNNKNLFPGTFTISGGSVELAYGNDGSSNALAISTGGTFALAGGTTLGFVPAPNPAAGVFASQLQTSAGGFTFGNAINITSDTATLVFAGNDNKWTFSGGVTGGTSGSQTLGITPGIQGSANGDRENILFNGPIANGSGGALGVSVDFAGGTSATQSVFVNLRGLNTFTGPITVTNSRVLTAGGYVVIGGERSSVAVTAGSGVLGGGNYANTIALAAGTVLDYLSTADQILGGVISGPGRVLKEGTGTLTLSAANLYAGTTTVSQGTLALGVSSAMPTASGVSLGGATLSAAASTTNTTSGTLTVTGAATINLGSGATLAFSNSSGPAWTGTLQITGAFNSGTSLQFGNDATGLTATQLGKITIPSLPGATIGLSNTGFLTASSLSGYAAYASAFSNPPLSNTAFNADPDNDGLSNGLEYVLGTDPRFSNQGGPTSSVVGTNLVFTFQRVDSSETPDVALVVQVSTNLTDWTTIPSYSIGADTASSTPGVTIAENGTAPDTITVTIPMGTDTKKFARLKLTGP